MDYTVEEVRAVAKRLHDDITVADGDALMASDMLAAYADSIERAQAAQVDPAWWVWRRGGAHPPAQAAQGDASPGRCKACGRATRVVCDGLDGNGLGCTNAPPIDLAAVREVIANHRSEAAKLSHDPESRDYLCEQADKLEAPLQEKGNGA